MAIKKICPICGNEFSANNGRKKYCSSQCYVESKKRNSKSHYEKYKIKFKNDSTVQKLSNNALHQLRMQRQQAAKKLGLTYGQYIARFGGELIP